VWTCYFKPRQRDTITSKTMIPVAKIASVATAILIPNAVGFTAASFTRKEVTGDWYKGLKKSSLNPPNWVFPVAWTSLYTAMGVASHMVYESGNGFSGSAALPLSLYAVQLVLNGIWNPLFFCGQRPDLALVDIIALDALVAGTIAAFYKVDRTAAYLMVPYMLWIAFATHLNFSIWFNNRKNH